MIRRAVAVVLLVACGSSSYAEENGTESGPCYPNGTCNDGLTCASNRCVRVATDGGSDGGAPNDASTDANVAADDAADGSKKTDASFAGCYPPTTAPSLKCGAATCNAGSKCCAGDDICKSPSTVCGGAGVSIECLSPAQCTGGQICCAKADSAFDGSCPALVNNVLQTKCRTSCEAGELSLCWGDGAVACGADSICVGGALEGSPGGNATVGVCISFK